MKTAEERREYHRIWREAHPDYDRNPDRTAKRLASTERWAKQNPEKRKASQARIYQRNRNEAIKKASAWSKAHPERCRANAKASRDRHPERWRARIAKRVALCKDANARGRGRAKIYGTIWEDCSAKIRFLKLLPFCQYCFTLIAGRKTVDHVMPLARGGTHAVGNLRIACLKCNCSKLDKLLSEWSGRLIPEISK